MIWQTQHKKSTTDVADGSVGSKLTRGATSEFAVVARVLSDIITRIPTALRLPAARSSPTLIVRRRCCFREVISMESIDIRYINALFNALDDPTYIPIVICTQSIEAEEYVQKKLNNSGVHFVVISENIEVDNVNGVIALNDIEKVEEDSTVQGWLSTLIERCWENKLPIILTSHKKINKMQIMEKLKCRLLWGVYVEL